MEETASSIDSEDAIHLEPEIMPEDSRESVLASVGNDGAIDISVPYHDNMSAAASEAGDESLDDMSSFGELYTESSTLADGANPLTSSSSHSQQTSQPLEPSIQSALPDNTTVPVHPSTTARATLIADSPVFSDQPEAFLINRRQLLSFQVVASEGNKWKGTLTLRQPQLRRQDRSPQGNRPDTLQLGACPTRSICEDLCRSVAPPVWQSKTSSSTCRLCRVPFSMFRVGHHCRNCGYLVCPACSDKLWPASMLPPTYCHEEKVVRVCHLCHLLAEHFVAALKAGDERLALAVYASGNLNLHNRLSVYQNHAYYVHCAASGGNLNLLRWLVEDKKCALFDRASASSPVQRCLRTASGLSVLAVAAQQGHLHIMRYLVHEKHCPLGEVIDAAVLQRGLHAALEAPGPLPNLSLPKAAPRVVVDDLLFGQSHTLLSGRLNGAISLNSVSGAVFNKHIKVRPCCVQAVQLVVEFLRQQLNPGSIPAPVPPIPSVAPVPHVPAPAISNLPPHPTAGSTNNASTVGIANAHLRALQPPARPSPSTSRAGTPITSSTPPAPPATPPSSSSAARSSTPVISSPARPATPSSGPPLPAQAEAATVMPDSARISVYYGGASVVAPAQARPSLPGGNRISIAMNAAVVQAEPVRTLQAYANEADVPVDTEAILLDDVVYTVQPPMPPPRPANYA